MRFVVEFSQMEKRYGESASLSRTDCRGVEKGNGGEKRTFFGDVLPCYKVFGGRNEEGGKKQT